MSRRGKFGPSVCSEWFWHLELQFNDCTSCVKLIVIWPLSAALTAKELLEVIKQPLMHEKEQKKFTDLSIILLFTNIHGRESSIMVGSTGSCEVTRAAWAVWISVHSSDISHFRRHFLLCLGKKRNQFICDFRIFLVEKRRRPASITGTTSSTDSVHIFVDFGRQVEVDHVTHVWNI